MSKFEQVHLGASDSSPSLQKHPRSNPMRANFLNARFKPKPIPTSAQQSNHPSTYSQRRNPFRERVISRDSGCARRLRPALPRPAADFVSALVIRHERAETKKLFLGGGFPELKRRASFRLSLRDAGTERRAITNYKLQITKGRYLFSLCEDAVRGAFSAPDRQVPQ